MHASRDGKCPILVGRKKHLFLIFIRIIRTSGIWYLVWYGICRVDLPRMNLFSPRDSPHRETTPCRRGGVLTRHVTYRRQSKTSSSSKNPAKRYRGILLKFAPPPSHWPQIYAYGDQSFFVWRQNSVLCSGWRGLAAREVSAWSFDYSQLWDMTPSRESNLG